MRLRITVHGVDYEVDVEVLDAGDGFPGGSPLPTPMGPPAGIPGPAPMAAPAPAAAAPAPAAAAPAAAAGAVGSPVAGTVIEVKASVGQQVNKGDTVVIIEAMKMHTNIAADRDGKITEILVAAGDSVREGQGLVKLG